MGAEGGRVGFIGSGGGGGEGLPRTRPLWGGEGRRGVWSSEELSLWDARGVVTEVVDSSSRQSYRGRGARGEVWGNVGGGWVV